MAPETTEGYEPYIHPHDLQGEEEKSTLKILLRDFKTAGLADLKKKLEQIIDEVQPLHPKARIELEIIESYRNMREGLEKDPRVLDCLWEAAKRAGLEPKWVPIRGGTDGSKPHGGRSAHAEHLHRRQEFSQQNRVGLSLRHGIRREYADSTCAGMGGEE